MITKFILFENMDLSDIDININMSKDKLNNIIDNLSLKIYKRKNNIKNLRIKSIYGNVNKNANIIIKMSNKDIIEGNYKNTDNSINIYINNELIYDVDYKKFNIEKLSEKIISEYKKYLKNKKWKIK